MIYLNLFVIVTVLFLAGIRMIRPTQRGLIVRLGKYRKFANPGFHWLIPFIDKMYRVDITKQSLEAGPHEMITYDKFITRVCAQVSFRVKSDEESLMGSIHNVNNYNWQIARLAQTILRNIIGTLMLNSARSQYESINEELYHELLKETQSWGIEIVGTELDVPDPPEEMRENDIALLNSY